MATFEEFEDAYMRELDTRLDAIATDFSRELHWIGLRAKRDADKVEKRIGRNLTHVVESQLAKADLEDMVQAVKGASALDTAELSVDEFNICSRSRRYGSLGYISLQGGVAILYTSQGFLENLSHRFVFPDEGEPAYHQEPFAVDCQAVGSDPVNLVGTTELLGNQSAVTQIRRIAPQVMLDASLGWDSLQPSGRVPAATC